MSSNPNPSHESFRYFLALALAPKVSPGIFKAILAYAGSAESFFHISKGEVFKTPRIGYRLLEILNSKDFLLRKADELIQFSEKKEFRILTLFEPDFPLRLKSLEDGPILLFAKGNADFNPKRTIGVVGTRSATSYGKAVTKKLIGDSTLYQPSIISGLAYGIDIQAHRESLAANLPTIGVLGSPIDQIYPAIHGETVEQMMENGAILSEYAPGSKIVPGNFPVRNRIIAGLSDALVVVESAARGRGLITAEIAYSYDKEVFAVPGNLHSPYSEGCNHLIRKMKAGIYTRIDDIAEALFWDDKEKKNDKNPQLDLSQRDEEERLIFNLLLEKKEMKIDQISNQTEIPIGLLSSKLLEMEFEGIIQSLPGKKYRLLV
jgi:DNA processing protein